MGKTYLCWQGLQELVKVIRGDEKISIGIRPYGFHAGNELTLYVYPWHLCNLLKQRGKEPEFTFFISLNDVEPESLKYLYPDEKGSFYYKREELTLKEEVPFEYNVFPKETSFQYTVDHNGCCASVSEHWEKVISEKVLRLKKDFPLLKFNFIRSSSILGNPLYKKAIKLGLNSPQVLGKIADPYEKVCFADNFLSWTGAICSSCHSAQGKTILENETVKFECDKCKKKSSSSIEETSFWMHHMLLLAPRLKMFRIDLFFRGYDHYSRNHIPINEQLYKALYGEELDIKTIVPPLIIRGDGKKMGKTWSNEKSMDTERLKKLVSSTLEEKIVIK